MSLTEQFVKSVERLDIAERGVVELVVAEHFSEEQTALLAVEAVEVHIAVVDARQACEHSRLFLLEEGVVGRPHSQKNAVLQVKVGALNVGVHVRLYADERASIVEKADVEIRHAGVDVIEEHHAAREKGIERCILLLFDDDMRK